MPLSMHMLHAERLLDKKVCLANVCSVHDMGKNNVVYVKQRITCAQNTILARESQRWHHCT